MRRAWCILVLLLAIPVQAALPTVDLEEVRQQYNANLDKVPGFAKKILGTERINAYVKMSDGSQLTLGAITNKGSVERLEYSLVEEPTLVITTSEAVVLTIMMAEDPAQQLLQALDSKEILVEPQNVQKRLKWGFGGTMVKLASWFQRLYR